MAKPFEVFLTTAQKTDLVKYMARLDHTKGVAIAFGLLYLHYEAYCLNSGSTKLTRTQLIRALPKLAEELQKPPIEIAKTDKVYLKNVSLKPEDEKEAKRIRLEQKKNKKKVLNENATAGLEQKTTKENALNENVSA